MKIIEITVNFIGRTTIETKGFTGSDCLEATRALEQALGLRTQEERTPEYYAPTNVVQPVLGQS